MKATLLAPCIDAFFLKMVKSFDRIGAPSRLAYDAFFLKMEEPQPNRTTDLLDPDPDPPDQNQTE